jgi:hypothetical protein
VLSLYLNLDPAGGERRDPAAAVHDAVASLRAQPLGEPLRLRLDEEADRVVSFLRDEHELHGRSLVVFSCGPRGLWEAFWLQVPVRSLARFAGRPSVSQLASILDEHERYGDLAVNVQTPLRHVRQGVQQHERYGVVLLDKERGRVLVVYLNRVEHDTDVFDAYPGRTAMGGWAQARYSHHRDAHLHRHVLHVAEAVQSEARRRPFDRLIAGGPDEALSALLSVLPRSLSGRLAGTFSAELFASNEHILDQVRSLEERAEREAEVGLVTQLTGGAAGGGPAVVGWDDTLQALVEGRVHKLVLAEGVSQAGRVCPAGHVAVVEPLAECPVCGAALEAVPALAERAVELAFDDDGSVETVRGEAREALTPHGGIGALLRY